MDTDFRVRPFRPDDYPAVSRIWHDLFPGNTDQSDSCGFIRQFLSRNSNLSFVAVKDSRLVGTVLAGHDTRRGYIYHLGVLPEFRRLGIGKTLLSAAETALAHQGIIKLHLFVFRENLAALSFYQHIGYKLRDDIVVCSKVLTQRERYVIEPMRPEEAETVYRMIETVFDRFVGLGYSDAGKATFKQFIQPGESAKRLQNGNFVLTAKDGGRIVGAIEIKALNHISLLFVDPEYHWQGIARQLWETASRHCRELRGDGAEFTVNSSLYAVPIYRKFGFTATGPEHEQDGIRFIPMVLKNYF